MYEYAELVRCLVLEIIAPRSVLTVAPYVHAQVKKNVQGQLRD